MKKANKTNKLTLVLFGLCAVIWTIKAAFDVADKTYTDSVAWFVMDIICAVLWIVCFIVSLKRYCSENEK